MKVKVISRNPDEYLRETKHEIHRVPRNYDPELHPFQATREYIRALNAVKLGKIFAKPFIGSLDGHRDGVCCMSKHPKHLSKLVSGAFDGEIRIWDLAQRTCMRNFVAHEGVIRGITFSSDASHFLTLGDDKTIKTWKGEVPEMGQDEEPVNTVISKTVLNGISHHISDPIFATAGEVCQIWEESRNAPIRSLEWGCDSLHDVMFNPVQDNLLASCASDRGIIIYDMRSKEPLRKVVMELRTNKLAWNPMEAYTFTCANEDYNLYTFDTRKLKKPVNVHMDHVSAVTYLDYAPTGREFVSGSYDKTIRIFETSKGHSREVYHTKRMQRLTCVQWSLDNKYIFSGSDEMIIRIWKARASEKLGPLNPREKASLQSSEKLKEKYAAHPKIRRIERHRHVPRHVYVAQKELETIKKTNKRKEANRRAHSKPGEVPHKPERAKHVRGEYQ